jgi:hypothetical protein
MDTKSQAPGFFVPLVSFVPFVPFVPFVSFVSFVDLVGLGWRGEHQGNDEAAQCVSDRRRHPITLTKVRGGWAGRLAGFAI